MNTKTLLYVLGTAVIFCSCVKEADKSPETVQGTEEVIIHATMAGDGNTKTVLQENGSVFWQPGDQIAVFFNSVKVPFTSYNSVDAASAYFVGNLDFATAHNEGSDGTVAGEYAYWGLYPLYTLSDDLYSNKEYYYMNHNYMIYFDRSDAYVNSDLYVGRIPSLLSAGTCDGKTVSTLSFYWQKGVAGTFDAPLNIALAKSDDYHELSFYNVLGGVRFSVQSPDITRVTFQGNNHEVLAGEFSMQMDAAGKPVITDVSDPYEVVTVTKEDGGAFIPGEWYYMMLFPSVLSKGYTMEFYNDNAKAKKVVTSSVEVKRSVFGSLANADAGLAFDTEVVYPSGGYSYLTIDGEQYVSIGGETQLKAHPKPENCTFPPVWRSEDPSIATIDADGKVRGISRGRTWLYCFVDYLYTTHEIKVLGEDECGSLTITTSEGNDIDYYDAQYLGEQVQLTAVPSPSSFTGTVVWSSNDESIAMVDQTGLVTVTGDGDCYITAQAGDATDQVWIYARNLDYSGISISITTSDGNDVSVVNAQNSGEQIQLTAVLTPSSLPVSVVWSSDNENVATVDQTGLVIITGEGSCHITARVGQVSDQVLVNTGDFNPGWVSIDGNFDDWDSLPTNTYLTSVNNPDSPWNGVTEIRCYADVNNVFYYIKFDEESLANAAAAETPEINIRLCINTDGEFSSGYSGYFLDSYDFIVEGCIMEDGAFIEFDGTLFQRIGSWYSLLEPGNGLVLGKGFASEYEISLKRSVFNEAAANSTVPMPMGDEFQTGIRFYWNGWTEFSNMPNSSINEEQGNGWGHLLPMFTCK